MTQALTPRFEAFCPACSWREEASSAGAASSAIALHYFRKPKHAGLPTVVAPPLAWEVKRSERFVSRARLRFPDGVSALSESATAVKALRLAGGDA
jgi:hypothetical protein